MTTVIRSFKWCAYSTAIGAWTLTPLMGFFVGDKRPSAAATALQMFVAFLLMLAATVLTLIQRYRHRVAPLCVTQAPIDATVEARRLARDAGLPWVEADGSVSWPDDHASRTTSP